MYTDNKGNIVRPKDLEENLWATSPNAYGEREAEGLRKHEYLTHALPDYVAVDKDGKLHILDYKSRSQGSQESLVQSAYYADLYTALAKKYYTAATEDEKAKYADYAMFGKIGESGKFESTIADVTGWDPLSKTWQRRTYTPNEF